MELFSGAFEDQETSLCPLWISQRSVGRFDSRFEPKIGRSDSRFSFSGIFPSEMEGLRPLEKAKIERSSSRFSSSFLKIERSGSR
jgi:hypothetical protein